MVETNSFTLEPGIRRIDEASTLISRLSQLLENSTGKFKNGGLYEGELGAAIFQFHCARFFSSESYVEKGFEHLSASISSFNSGQQTFTLAEGLTGLAWSLHYLKELELLSEEDADIVSPEILLAIERSMQLDIRNKNLDLMYGYIGKSIMFDQAGIGLEKTEIAINALQNSALWDCDGCYWIDSDHSQKPVVNMGLAHGMPGIVMFLLKISSQRPEIKFLTMPLLEGACKWISRQHNTGLYSRFPTGVAIGKTDQHPSRLAWCYGDLGIALMFAKMYRDSGNLAWREEAVLTINQLAARTVEDSGIASDKENGRLDIGVCHGTSGIFALYNSLYQETGDAGIREKALEWLDLTLENVKKCLDNQDSIDRFDQDASDLGLLNGLSGAGLVLLTMLNPGDNAWTKLFLID